MADGTIHYVYDDATGELIETWSGTDHSEAQNDILYGYDSQGRLASVSEVVLNGQTPTAISGETRYDADGNAVSTSDPTILYSYDAAGNLAEVSDPNGMATQYSYDDENELTDELVTDTITSEPIFAEHYDLNDDGSRADEIDTRYNGDGSVFSKTQTDWTYDADDRLTGESLEVLAGSGTGVPTAYSDTFSYDLANNRTEEDINGGDSTSGGQSIRYTYNNDDQLLTETETQYGGSQVYQTTYTYDANGNLATQVRTGSGAESDVYSYDLRNRMISDSETIGETTATTTYGYDTDGVLARETTNAGTDSAASTYYLNDPNNPTGYTKAIQESATLGGAPTRSYVLGLKVEAQSDATNGTLYLLTDGHGSTRAVMNAAVSRGAPKPASAGRSKPARVVMRCIPHLFDPMHGFSGVIGCFRRIDRLRVQSPSEDTGITASVSSGGEPFKWPAVFRRPRSCFVPSASVAIVCCGSGSALPPCRSR